MNPLLTVPDVPQQTLGMMWWNAGLSPVRGERADSQREQVLDWLATISEGLDLDFIGLCEVTNSDMNDIMNRIGQANLVYHDAAGPAGKTKFDLAVLYNGERLDLVDSKPLLDAYGSETIKVGEHLHLYDLDTALSVHVIVSHWPSRLYLKETDPKRAALGMALRSALNAIREGAGEDPSIILMGDFNDDPCSVSLASHVLGTRDRDLVANRPHLMYNPFWRYLGESEPYRTSAGVNGICGTYYYASGLHTRWHTFDQMLFSSDFVASGPWALDEASCQILEGEAMISDIKARGKTIDHLPIVGAIYVRGDA